MRVLSTFERRLLRQITGLEELGERLLSPHQFLKGLLAIKSQVTLVGRSYDYELKEGESHYYKVEILGNADEINSEYFEVLDKFYQTNDLLDYLLQNGYLLRREGGASLGLLINKQHHLVEGENNVNKIDVNLDTPLKQFLEKCSYYYNSTEALRDLVKHDFRTKAERNNYWTRVISIVSVIISVFGLYISFYVDSKNSNAESHQVIEIDTSSINYYIRKIQKETNAIPLKR
jgi:hypothetical protein